MLTLSSIFVLLTLFLFLSSYSDHPDLHSFPTRRSSDLQDDALSNAVAAFHHNWALGDVDDLHFHFIRRAAVVRIEQDRKSTRLNSSHLGNSYAVFCLKKKK